MIQRPKPDFKARAGKNPDLPAEPAARTIANFIIIGYTWRQKSYRVCHSGLEPESSFSWIPAFAGMTTFAGIKVAVYRPQG